MTSQSPAFFVDAWDPAYGASFEAAGGAGPAAPSSAQVDADVELPAADWRAIGPRAGVRSPDVVLLVDGVRRIDASVWTAEEDGGSFPGIAASYAAGVVRCDLDRGAAEMAGARVGRGLFTASPSAQDVVAGTVRYPVHRVSGTGELSKLPAAVQAPLTALEVAVSDAVRTDGDLLVVDGPLRSRRNLPRTLGYIKTQHSQYLDGRLTAVVTGLAPGERCPVFRLGTAWGGWSWYLRLPVRAGAPWAGIVRVECSADLTVPEAIALADLSLVTLPRFASTPYKDPRAPQNLVPIAGLERRLRGMLGDARLLHRVLTAAARGMRR
ncbi:MULTISPECIES: hypothetical protein [Micromonospora]|uniref:hypothetical protein n=1 Tax=Micromonospora TaxID=1873 RepID=UPI0003EEDF3A|nr:MULTISPECIES: hypothetical protein [unclassified Micromonospora]EWM65172.1 hypothetical protein MCBG_02305 [Micromonospora sp. M42]MCK1810120.1 hypothetical protein [Micromonospora sp. R42106]MCK1832586.1 hypothetical protein [Micromonospora sp. R42003]MCK1844013.1 hypothetical protein [Micromonospora sp. R42004]MCM1020494.1 hypothetical protein [Micromonospora sp. XM-20-01]